MNNGEASIKSILDMRSGALKELVDYKMLDIIKNIRDPNAKAKVKRKLKIVVEFTPDESRVGFTTRYNVDTVLSPVNPIETTLFIAGDDSNGYPLVQEIPQCVPGQMDLSGGEQESPPLLRLVGR